KIDDGSRRRGHLQHVTERSELHHAVHQRNGAAAATKDRREVHGDRRLARAALRRVADDHLSLRTDRALRRDRERVRELDRAARQDEHGVDALIRLGIDRSLRDGDDDDPRPWRYRPDPLGEIEPGDLPLKQGIDHHHIGLLGGDARHRGVRVLFRADELGFLLAREHLLQVLRDLRQVLDEQDSFHAARVYVAARPRAMFEAAAPVSASPMNDTPRPATVSAPRKTERTSAMCAYSSEVKIGPVPYAIGGFAAAPITYDAHA